jgi:hypothetical protein
MTAKDLEEAMSEAFGRGIGRGRGINDFSNYPMKEYKFAPHTQGKTNTVTYASTKDKVVQHAQEYLKCGYDIAKSRNQGKLIDIGAEEPKRMMLTKQMPLKNR